MSWLINVYWVRKQELWIEQGKWKRMPGICVDIPVCSSFCTDFLACYFGQDFIISVVQAIPAWLGDTFVIFGKMLPAVGFCDAAAVCAG